jgi:recombination protein RecT
MSTPTTLTKSQKDAQQTEAVKRLAAFLAPREKNLAIFARNGVQPGAMIKLALFEASQQDWFAAVTPQSVYTALVVAAQLGLEPAGLRGEAYLIKFGNECKLMPGYRGLIKLALNSGKVRDVTARVVYEGDDFAVHLGTEERIHHVPMTGRIVAEKEQPRIIAAYAVARMADGSSKFEAMDRWELDRVREVSKTKDAKDGPWATWPDQMYRKAPVRRLAKYLPLGNDYFRALVADDVAEGNDTMSSLGSIIDLPPESAEEESAAPEGGGRIAGAIEAKATERKGA